MPVLRHKYINQEEKMKTARKLVVFIITVIMTLAAVAVITACSPAEQPPDDETYAFKFVGSGKFNDDTTYNITITGSEDDDSFELLIKELPMFQLDGTYVYVEGKGYKLYFEDAGSQFVYTAYDTESKIFSFTYDLNLGEALGTRSVPFTWTDSSFASAYDGEGLGPVPPTFTGGGWGGYIGQFEITPATIRCYEDGSAIFTAVAVTAVDPKYGTWEYDRATNTYHLNFPPQSYANSSQTEVRDGVTYYHIVYGESDHRYDVTGDKTATDFYTTYDDSTDTYSLEVQIVWYIYSMIYFTYVA